MAVNDIHKIISMKDISKIIHLLLNKNFKGIINIGGKKQSVYKFVKRFNPKIKKSYAKKLLGSNYPLKLSINIQKLNVKLSFVNGLIISVFVRDIE